MGQMLTTAVSSQYIQRWGDEDMRVGSSHMQGCRPNMEDADTVQLRLDSHPEISFFGVYDGHAGAEVSEYLSVHLVKNIDALEDPMDPEAVKKAVLDTDAAIGELENIKQAGSTACFALIRRTGKTDPEGRKLYTILVGNVGDSRAMIIRPDGSFQALTVDHKPETPEEHERIQAAGGHVQMNRVDGQLAMSRAMGDFGYKDNDDLPVEEQKVIPVPDIGVHDLLEGESLLLCCDGIVEQLSNEAVAEFVHSQQSGTGEKQGHGGVVDEGEFEDPLDPGRIVYNLLHYSVTNGSLDNHSAILVQLKDGQGYTKELEFVPGPFGAFKDEAFREAYLEDARRHGFEDEEEIAKLSAEADQKLPKHVLEEQESGNSSISDPMDILRLVTGADGSNLEFEQRMQLLQMLSGGQLQLVRPGEPGYDDDEEEDGGIHAIRIVGGGLDGEDDEDDDNSDQHEEDNSDEDDHDGDHVSVLDLQTLLGVAAAASNGEQHSSGVPGEARISEVLDDEE